MDLWAQFYLIDLGETLGRTISMFRDAFFNCKINYWGGYEYTLKNNMEDKLYERIKNKSIRYSEDEVNDLPDKVYINKYVIMPDEAFGYYDKAREGMIEALKGKKDYHTLQNNFIKFRQITSGFMRFKEEETNDKFDVEFKDNPKLDMLEELLLDVPSTSKVVIFNEFQKSGDMICARLKKLKIKHSRLYGGTKDKEKARDKFLNDKKCKVFVVNSQSGGVGLNLQIANYCVSYESPVSPIVRKQAEKRCHRDGSERTVFFYDIVMRDSVDEKILEYLEEGKDLFEAIVEGKEVV
jgi:SNF2 family DNA or RNA helicase